MDSTQLIQLFSYTLPSLITGGVAYYLFDSYFKDQQHTRKWLLQKETKPAIMPLRLQAYERMTLLMERINPAQLLVRVPPIATDKKAYQDYLIAQIEQEFEHNLAQQIYISAKCWAIILTAKNATIQMILVNPKKDNVEDANGLRESILKELLEKSAPSNTAIAFIKDEVSELF
ncbi:hypothetical protein [Flavobacterium sp. UMI-01]|uniref:DUF7935 family protein n=1 Tax=Flavobacterium sp. UMI-01 TaxID=1441053 RepID=UPI001C7CE1DC|nr:hypothetical protein [Flavobacterium sp. UMI-01]GIZ08472.1 hypothetical protein FUMI01_11990 [Flavobacterium sp. UMI-01]